MPELSKGVLTKPLTVSKHRKKPATGDLQQLRLLIMRLGIGEERAILQRRAEVIGTRR